MVDICLWSEDKNNITELKIKQSWQEVINWLSNQSYYWQDMSNEDDGEYLYIQCGNKQVGVYNQNENKTCLLDIAIADVIAIAAK